ncbi:MAG TPA: PVC-type heme-binding CxxCH protein, partial [Methylomirabilota bacterium]|nr:PVC-type heme-binding CxxCH protein [Methylomirabilota bacterium]
MIRMRLRSPLRVPVLPFLIFVSLAFGGSAPALFAAGLEYLDAADPFHPGASTAKLTTPQWIGEPGVEAAVVLAIDDLRDTARYEQYLRPILNRLKRIDGRAPVSIMINAVDPNNPQLQRWLQEGLSLEVHTLGHPCPCLARGDFEGAAATYHGCVDLLGHIPGNRPVAFRMPCCDSMNSPSPRFYAEIFNRVSPEGRFLTLDSSVMNLFTPADASLPRELVQESSGRERFRRYLPAETNATTPVSMKSFATTIENYPYPYVFGTLAWQFPATVPSDWEAQNVNGKNSPVTVADWKAALDLTVLKQGVFTFIFHPHGWIRPEQMIEFIDYAVSRYGPRVKFLTFREAQERIDRHLLAGQPLRAPGGGDNGVRVLDLNNDGFMDVVIGNAVSRRTRIWDPGAKRWREGEFPTDVGSVRFGRLDAKTTIALRLVAGTSPSAESWVWHNGQWQPDPSLRAGLELDGRPVIAFAAGRDRGLRLRDVDRDGTDEVIVGNESQRAVFRWQASRRAWEKAAYTLPEGTAIVDAEGHDAGLRFVDVNEDGFDDVLFSNPERTSLHLFIPKTNARLMFYQGWNDEVFAANRRELDLGIPPIVRAGSRRNNGVWFARSTMWVQNEDTAHLPDKVDRRTFAELLRADQPKPMTPEQALAAFRVRPGFTVELVAAEPLVRDPIAFDWSADGRLWVVEMGDYPEGIGPERKPAGTVRLLEDTNGDGRYDKGTVFLEGLRYPTGVFPWRRGVLVSAAPDIIYAEDTDGDGRADRRETLFTGFAEGNPQHLVNGFEYGLDNWIYGANGDSGGKVRPAGMPGATAIDLSGRDFRFRPDDRRLESETGQTQFGRRRDDWGRWFGNNNPTWLWHYFVPERYLRRNPHLILKSAKRMLADYPNGTRLFPASRTRQRFNDHHQFHHVTSACSPTPYRDDLFGADFADSVFISDPVHNLIHREVLVRDGASFLSRRAEDEMDREFLASADNWFRPTTLKTGPDGALYIADMYRLVLEHPEWIPDPIEPRLDLRAGADMGRIYRVFPTGAALRRPPRLDRMNAAELAAALDSGNGWQRDTAQRLLV